MTTQDWHVLVVEDDPDGQEVVAILLEQAGVEVETANDGEHAEALLFAGQRRYDAVIIDLALPGKDGWDLIALIRQTPALAALPCIAVTAYHTSKTHEEALEAGFSVYLPKPIDGVKLLDALQSLL